MADRLLIKPRTCDHTGQICADQLHPRFNIAARRPGGDCDEEPPGEVLGEEALVDLGLHVGAGPVPVVIDAGLFDEVAPAELTRGLMCAYRRRGVDLTTHWWSAHHSGTMQARHAPGRAARWMLARLATTEQ